MAQLNRTDLHTYQERGVQWILQNPRCGLFLTMGLGKTVTTLTAISELYDKGQVNRVLVIGPKRVIESVWKQEAAKWSHLQDFRMSIVAGSPKKRTEALRVPADIYLISKDNVVWLCNLFRTWPFDMVVIDESSTFKNHQAKRFKAFRKVSPGLRRIVLLTGTPAPNGLMDLWAQLYLIDRGHRLGAFIGMYRRAFFNEGARRGHVVFNYRLKRGADKQIYDRIADVCMSMTAKDYLELPERVDNFIRVPLAPRIQKLYAQLRKDSIISLSQAEVITASQAVTLANKLTQLANGNVYDEDKKVVTFHTHKLDALDEIIEDAGGAPMLVAYTYQHDRDRILNKFESRGARVLQSDQDIQEWNDGQVPILLLHPASGGHGLNLQYGGNTLVWYGQTWNLELYQQLNARLHRQGQNRTVVCHHLIAEGTIDEQIMRMVQGKAVTQDSLLDALKDEIVKNLGSDIAIGPKLTRFLMGEMLIF